MKRFLVLALALCLVLGVCSVPTAFAADAPKGVKTIVLFNNSGVGNSAGAEAGSSDAGYDMVQQKIYEETGTWVEAMFPSGDATTQLNLLLASGEQIDMFWGNWRTYASSGIIQPWTQYLPEYPAIVAAWEDWNAWPGVTDADGTVWGMPRMTPTSPYQIYVRQDWLDLMDMAQPTTLDELNEYLYAVQKLDPYGNGNTIPLGVRTLDEVRFCFMAGFTGKGNGYWLDETDGLVKPSFLQEGYKDFMQQVATWYKDGIIHRESFSWDTNTLRDNISRGQVAATATWYSSITTREIVLYEALVQQGIAINTGSNSEYLYDISDVGIMGPSGTYVESHTGAQSQALLMHTNCVDPKAALNFISWQYEGWDGYNTAANGIENVHWRFNPDVEDAEVNYAITGWKDDKGTAMYMNAKGELGYTNDLLYVGNFNAGIGLPNEVKTTTYEAQTGRQGMHNFWLQNRLNKFETAVAPELDYQGLWDTITLAENVPHNGDITTYFNEESLKFVIGTRPMTEWDSFINELYKIGLQDRIDEYTRQYNATIE